MVVTAVQLCIREDRSDERWRSVVCVLIQVLANYSLQLHLHLVTSRITNIRCTGYDTDPDTFYPSIRQEIPEMKVNVVEKYL
jgi:hypothetical protein